MVKKIGFMYDGDRKKLFLNLNSSKDYLLQRDIQLIGPVKLIMGKINYYTDIYKTKVQLKLSS